ncbi:unnamed protein product, partial [Allacma fusca]
RRYKCWDVQQLKRMWIHEAILQVSGPPFQEMQILSDQLSGFQYKIVCNCKYCLSYKESIKAEHLVSEPMIKGTAVLFTVLTQLGYEIKSSTVTQNNDGSSSTTWVLVKLPTTSDL